MKPHLVMIVLVADLVFCVLVCAALWFFVRVPQPTILLGSG